MYHVKIFLALYFTCFPSSWEWEHCAEKIFLLSPRQQICNTVYFLISSVFHETLYFSRLWIKVIPQGHLIKKFMLDLQISTITHRSLIGKSTKSVWMKVCQSTLLFSGKKSFFKSLLYFVAFFLSSLTVVQRGRQWKGSRAIYKLFIFQSDFSLDFNKET